MPRSYTVLFCLFALCFSSVLVHAEDALLVHQSAEGQKKSAQGADSKSSCRDVLNSAPRSWQGQMEMGRCHFIAGEYTEAAGSFEKALQLSPDNPEILHWLGRSYLQDRHPEKVFELMSRVTPTTANSAVAHMLLARAYDAEDKLDEARHEIQQALEIDPQCRGAHFALGFIAWTIRDLETAEKEFRQELNLNSHVDLTFYYLAETLELQGKLADAETVLTQMGREAPNSYLYHFGVGKLNEHKGNFAKAAEGFREAIPLDPKNPEAHYHLALALRRLGETAQANEEFELCNRLRAEMPPQVTQGMGRMRPHLPDFD
jgi:Flp pilus assembly protein TadD